MNANYAKGEKIYEFMTQCCQLLSSFIENIRHDVKIEKLLSSKVDKLDLICGESWKMEW